MTKKDIRRRMREMRNAYVRGEEDSRRMTEVLRSSVQYRCAKQVFIFVPFRNEPDLTALLHYAEADHKIVAVPRVIDEHKMVFYRADHPERWERSAMGILEPTDRETMIEADENTLILVPGLAYDRRGYRIGYGGGFYDVYLTEHPRAVTMGAAYPFQIVSDVLPAESYDRALDFILHTEGIDRCER